VWKEKKDGLEEARRAYARTHNKYSLATSAEKSKAELTLKRFQSEIERAAFNLGQHTRNANAAGKAEAVATTIEAEQRHAATKDQDRTATATREMGQFRNMVPDAIPDLSQDEMGRAANALADGATAKEVIANLLGERTRAVQARKDEEVKTRQNARLQIAQENHDVALKSFKMREESAERAAKSGKAAEYEKTVTDSEQEVSRTRSDWTAVKGTEDEPTAKALYEAAVASMHRVRLNRPSDTPKMAPYEGDVNAAKDDIAPVGTQEEWDGLSSEAKAIVRKRLSGRG
jgi:hypothetical protein